MDLSKHKDDDVIKLPVFLKMQQVDTIEMPLYELRGRYFSCKKGYIDNGRLFLLNPTEKTKNTFYVDEFGRPHSSESVQYTHLKKKIDKEEEEGETYKMNERFLRSLNMDEKHAFSLLLLIKNKFQNGRVYEYNPTRLSKKLKISRHYIAKYVPIIIKRKWGYLENGQLVLRSYKRFIRGRRLKRYYLEIKKTDGIKDIVEKINFIIFRNNIVHQKKVGTVRSHCANGNNGLTYQQFKKLYKKFDKEMYSGAVIGHPVLGMRRLAKMLKCSLDYAARFINKLVKKKIIKIKREAILLKKGVRNFDLSSFNFFGYCFVYRNCLYSHIGTHVLLPE